MEAYTYLFLDLAAVSIPFFAGFHPRLAFYKKWKYLFPAILVAAIPFIAWDIYFTAEGIWGFNPRYLTGLYFLGLPLEEWLFFFCIPYACVFTYEALKTGMRKAPFSGVHTRITSVLAVVLLVCGLIFVDRAYTAVTFLGTALFLFLHLRFFKRDYLGWFYFSFLLILLPFFLVNGILTGSVIEEEVVWYNDAENLGLRLFTIPVEDSCYALLLLLLTVTVYEKLKGIY